LTLYIYDAAEHACKGRLISFHDDDDDDDDDDVDRNDTGYMASFYKR